MIERARGRKPEIIRVDGMKVHRLRGGFLALHNPRARVTLRPRPVPKAGRKAGPAKGRKPVRKSRSPGGKGRAYLYCRKCGTLVEVEPPVGSVLCCKRRMALLREVPPPGVS